MTKVTATLEGVSVLVVIIALLRLVEALQHQTLDDQPRAACVCDDDRAGVETDDDAAERLDFDPHARRIGHSRSRLRR